MPPDSRISQASVEVAVTPAASEVRTTQLSVEAVVLPLSDVICTQAVLEVIHNLPLQVLLSGSLTPQGDYSGEVTESPLGKWLQRRLKKSIFLVTLTLRYASGSSVLTETLYLSNHAVNTRASETPANTEFIAVLRDEDLPTFNQELSEVFFGLSTPSFGALVINNADGQFDSLLPPYRQWEGGAVEIKLTGDRSELALSDGVTILTGVMGKVEATDTSIRVEIFSRHKEFERKQLPTDTFTGPNGDLIVSPILYGYGTNISPILKDAVNLTYKIAGHQLDAITAVYDRGVLLATSQYTTDLANGEFTLNQNPAGVITCDARGKPVTGSFTAKRGDFIYDALISYGGMSSVDIDEGSRAQFNAAVPGDSGIYLTEAISILEMATQLLHPVLGFFYFSRSGKATFGVLTLPTVAPTVTLTLTADELIPGSGATSDDSAAGDVIETKVAELLYSKVSLQYGQNLTTQDEDSLGAVAPVDPSTASGRARREYLSKEWRTAIIELTGPTVGRSLYPTAGEFGPIPSYFINRGDCNDAAQKILDLFGQARRVLQVQCKTLPLQSSLNAVIRIRYRAYNDTLARAIGYREDYAGNTVGLTLLV